MKKDQRVDTKSFSVRVLCMNVQSIQSREKKSKLMDFVEGELFPDILSLTETRLNHKFAYKGYPC